MHVLITWGTKMGGTEGIARIIAEQLRDAGFNTTVSPAREVRDVTGYDAAIVAGALYANRWHRDARRFVLRHTRALRRIPVWFVSSGPLDASADTAIIAPPRQVETLMERVGARGHVTFGGRLPADAKGFPASAMAKEHAGDWRNPERIRTWAGDLARELPAARPGRAIDHPAHSPSRLIAHGVAGWAACAAVLMLLLAITSTNTAIILHTIAAPIIFAIVSQRYFAARGTREPILTAAAFTAIVAILHLVVVSGLFIGSFAMWRTVTGMWLPLALVFFATWITGLTMSTLPWPKPPTTQA